MIEKAKRFCVLAHGQQKRKYTGEPYWMHPFAVAEAVASVTNNESAIAAAYLHDVVEDTPTTIEDIKLFFGVEVADLVRQVTDVSTHSDGNRKVRKELDRSHLANTSFYGATIKLADLIDNSESIILFDPNFAKVYMSEKRALLSVLNHGAFDLLVNANKIVDGYFYFLDGLNGDMLF